MLALPSVPNIVFSTAVFFVAVWYLHRRLDEYDVPKGMTRNMLVFTLATVVSMGAGAAADWVHKTKPGTPQAIQVTGGTSQQPTDDSQAPE